MQRTSASAVEKQALQLLEEMFANIPNVLGVQLWNGRLWPDAQPRAATLVLKSPEALAGILSAGTEAGLAEGYLNNDFDLEGDIEAAFECVDVLARPPQRLAKEMEDGGSILEPPWQIAATHFRRPIAKTARAAAFAGTRSGRGDVSLRFIKRFLPPLARRTNGLLLRIF
jgi:hypothetical protein